MRVDVSTPVDVAADPRGHATLAEREGYDALWLSETKHDPLLQLALVSIVTSRVQLGTAITLAFARNPMSLAVAANDLQIVSGGRLLLGLGSQIKPHITKRFGMPWSHPAARMREYVLAMRAIWKSWHTGEPLSFTGEFYTHTLMTPFFVPEKHPYGPPAVLLAGVGEVMTQTAGEVADGFLCHGFTTERYLREVTLPALRRGRGRELDGFDICGTPLVATGRDERELAAARAGVQRQIAFYGSTPAYRGVLELHGWGELGVELNALSKQGAWDEMGRLVTDDVIDAFAVVGEPETVADKLLARYGDIFTRVTLYTPYDVAPELYLQIGSDMRSLAAV